MAKHEVQTVYVWETPGYAAIVLWAFLQVKHYIGLICNDGALQKMRYGRVDAIKGERMGRLFTEMPRSLYGVNSTVE